MEFVTISRGNDRVTDAFCVNGINFRYAVALPEPIQIKAGLNEKTPSRFGPHPTWSLVIDMDIGNYRPVLVNDFKIQKITDPLALGKDEVINYFNSDVEPKFDHASIIDNYMDLMLTRFGLEPPVIESAIRHFGLEKLIFQPYIAPHYNPDENTNLLRLCSNRRQYLVSSAIWNTFRQDCPWIYTTRTKRNSHYEKSKSVSRSNIQTIYADTPEIFLGWSEPLIKIGKPNYFSIRGENDKFGDFVNLSALVSNITNKPEVSVDDKIVNRWRDSANENASLYYSAMTTESVRSFDFGRYLPVGLSSEYSRELFVIGAEKRLQSASNRNRLDDILAMTLTATPFAWAYQLTDFESKLEKYRSNLQISEERFGSVIDRLFGRSNDKEQITGNLKQLYPNFIE